ncbi:hypothetical protein CPLU01_06445 [Colletotrichum plurivorum]|uniref:Uncharacterized protein n=1 Tax=Colletotrichum plurivorum TaxID=2175906 RepID=A0A8H6KIM0_9PEZI|nr:hypothetical protein CPLU01_06445 [Colletotrichum plurivorum]
MLMIRRVLHRHHRCSAEEKRAGKGEYLEAVRFTAPTSFIPRTVAHSNPLVVVSRRTISVAGGEYFGSRAPSRPPGLVLCSTTRGLRSPRGAYAVFVQWDRLQRKHSLRLRPSQGPTDGESRSRALHGKSLSANLAPWAAPRAPVAFASLSPVSGRCRGCRRRSEEDLGKASNVIAQMQSMAVGNARLPRRDGAGPRDDGSERAARLRSSWPSASVITEQTERWTDK